MNTPNNTVYAFECSVAGHDRWATVINHRTRGRAKAAYWRDLQESWPDIPFTEIRARKVGGPHTSERFKHNAKYRGMSDVSCGQRVSVGKNTGVIVGHNPSANFDVLFDDDAPEYAGMTLNVHPGSVELLEEEPV